MRAKISHSLLSPLMAPPRSKRKLCAPRKARATRRKRAKHGKAKAKMHKPKPKEDNEEEDSKQEMQLPVTEEIPPPALTPASPAAVHAAALPLTPERRETDDQRKKRCKALAAAWRAKRKADAAVAAAGATAGAGPSGEPHLPTTVGPEKPSKANGWGFFRNIDVDKFLGPW